MSHHTPVNPGRCSPGASAGASPSTSIDMYKGRLDFSSPGGSRGGSTSPGTDPRDPIFTSSELRDNCPDP